MNDIGRMLLAFVGSIMTLSILAVVVSQKSDTPALVQDTAGGLAEIIQAADSPVTGNTTNYGVGGQSSSGGGFSPTSFLTGASGGSDFASEDPLSSISGILGDAGGILGGLGSLGIG